MADDKRQIPMGIWVKRPKGSSFCPPTTMRSFRRMVGLAPTRVMVPPIMAQNAMGINTLEVGMPNRLDILWVTGMNRAAAPIFCIMLEMMPTVPAIRRMTLLSLLPARARMGLATLFITPVLSRPAPMIITAIMEQTALLERPEKASLGVTRPIMGNRTIIIIPTTSTLTHSKINKQITKTRTIMVIIISGVIYRILHSNVIIN